MVDRIDGGLLFTGKDVLSRLLTLKAQNAGKQINNAMECAVQLYCHWVHCNVYPITIQGIAYRIQTMFQAYSDIRKYDKKIKTSEFWKKCSSFVESQYKLFDIK